MKRAQAVDPTDLRSSTSTKSCRAESSADDHFMYAFHRVGARVEAKLRTLTTD